MEKQDHQYGEDTESEGKLDELIMDSMNYPNTATK